MGKVHDLATSIKDEIKTLLQNSAYSRTEIVHRIGVSISSVDRVARKLNKGEEFEAKRVGRCGPKPKTSPRDPRRIVRMALENRKTTAGGIKDMVQADGLDISRRTVNRVLEKAGLTVQRSLSTPMILPRMVRE